MAVTLTPQDMREIADLLAWSAEWGNDRASELQQKLRDAADTIDNPDLDALDMGTMARLIRWLVNSVNVYDGIANDKNTPDYVSVANACLSAGQDIVLDWIGTHGRTGE